jgi:hypothetical protein
VPASVKAAGTCRCSNNGNWYRAEALRSSFEETSGRAADVLNNRQIATPSGRPWSAKTVIRHRMLLCRAGTIAGGHRHEPIKRLRLAI